MIEKIGKEVTEVIVLVEMPVNLNAVSTGSVTGLVGSVSWLLIIIFLVKVTMILGQMSMIGLFVTLTERFVASTIENMTTTEGFTLSTIEIVTTTEGFALSTIEIVTTTEGFASSTIENMTTTEGFASSTIENMTTTEGFASSTESFASSTRFLGNQTYGLGLLIDY